MRLDNIKNFRGYSYITKEEFGIADSNATLLKNLFVGSKINPNYIDSAATTVNVTTNSGITGDGSASNALALDFTIIGENLTKVGKSGTGTIAITGTGLTYNGNALNAANGLVKLDANAKIAASQLPDLAITQVYTKAVTSSNSTVLAEIKAAITDTGVQRGDVVILTATDKAIADAFAGSYIFTADVAEKANITTDDYVKMYAPAGTVTSVNNVAPVAGNVTVGWGNIGDKSVTSITYTAEAISINTVPIATKAYAEKVADDAESKAKSYTDTRISSTSTTLKAYADDKASVAESNAKNYADSILGSTSATLRLEISNAKTTAITSANGYTDGRIASTSTTLKTYADGKAATAESNAKSYTDTQIGSLVTANASIALTEPLPFTWGTKTDGVASATLSKAGNVIAVLDETGMQCFPEITYNGSGVATIRANWGDITPPVSGFKAIIVKPTIALTGLA